MNIFHILMEVSVFVVLVPVENANVSILSTSQKRMVLKWSQVTNRISYHGKLKNIKNLFNNQRIFNSIFQKITSQ
jgi:hypothetical protein